MKAQWQWQSLHRRELIAPSCPRVLSVSTIEGGRWYVRTTKLPRNRNNRLALVHMYVCMYVCKSNTGKKESTNSPVGTEIGDKPEAILDGYSGCSLAAARESGRRPGNPASETEAWWLNQPPSLEPMKMAMEAKDGATPEPPENR